MRLPVVRGLLIHGLSLTAAGPVAAQAVPSRDSIVAFVDAAVLPMDRERLLEHQTVLIRGSVIAAIGPVGSVAIPKGSVRIDGRGKFLMPGLVDMHAHFMGGKGEPGDGASRQFTWFLANGVTAARGLGSPPGYLTTRDRANRGEVLAPMLYTAGGSINGSSVHSPEEAARVVREAKAAGYDWIKTHGGIDRVTYDSMIGAARAAHIPVSGHVSHEYGLLHALESHQQVEHLDGYLAVLAGDTGKAGEWNDQQIVTDPAILARIDEARIPNVVAATRRSGTCSGPTLALFKIVARGTPAEEMSRWPEMRFVAPKMLESFTETVQQNGGPPAGDPNARRFVEIRDHVVKALYDAGVPLLVGGDSPQFFMVPGFSLHREMDSFREAGIPPYGVLQAATLNAARCLGLESEFGTVSVGKRADLLLLDSDPRSDLAQREHLAGVMTRGRWLSREALAASLERLTSH
ncbi:MAG: amidohydrolase family protein [Gemmatimonadota bacterium]